jgi:hypothetical protein
VVINVERNVVNSYATKHEVVYIFLPHHLWQYHIEDGLHIHVDTLP